MKTFEEQSKRFKKRYRYIHLWLNKMFGKASFCSNKDCNYKNTKRFEWALIKGKKYEQKIDNFKQLCVSCHRKYDMTDKLRSKMSSRQIGKEIHKTKIKSVDNSGKITPFKSIKEASIINKCGRGSIVDVLKGRRNSCYNIKYFYE